MQSALEAQQVLRWLGIVRWTALADLVLLLVLLVASFANNEKMVQIFGLTHGIVFLALIAIVGIGAVQKLWTWWFLVGTLVTTGPPGALVGEVLIARKAKAILAASKGETTDRQWAEDKTQLLVWYRLGQSLRAQRTAAVLESRRGG